MKAATFLPIRDSIRVIINQFDLFHPVDLVYYLFLIQFRMLCFQRVGGSPPKPWEQEGNNNASGPNPFRPPSNTSTADSVEASGTANPGELVSSANRTNTAATAMNGLGRPVPSRPWEQQNSYGSTYGGGMCRCCVTGVLDSFSFSLIHLQVMVQT